MNCKHRLCRVHLEDFLCMCLNFFSFLSFGSSDLCHKPCGDWSAESWSSNKQHSSTQSFFIFLPMRVLCTGHWVLGTTKFGKSLAFSCHPFFGGTHYLSQWALGSQSCLPDVPGPYAPIRSIWPAIAALTGPKASWPIKQWSSYSKWDG